MQRFIDPKALARIKNMPLIAKTVAEGFLHGLQNSRQRGIGIEFNQYRSYQPGDELSRIDWKLFARSDRYFVREAERESEIEVWFLLDASYSMQQHSVSKEGWNKFDYARHLIASLAYLAQKQGDSIGYCSLANAKPEYLIAGNGETHWRKLLIALQQTQCHRNFADPTLLQRHLATLNKPALIFVVSDLNQRENEITDFLGQLKNSKNEVIAVQVVCQDEIDFNFRGAIRFKDLETNQEVLVSAASTKKQYLEAFRAYQSSIENILVKSNINLQSINIDQPLDTALYEYLKLREKTGR